jgi:replicative DNA helicase
MSAEQLATRIVAEQTGIPSNKIRRGLLNEGDLAKTRETKTQLQNLPLYIDDTGGLSIAQVLPCWPLSSK